MGEEQEREKSQLYSQGLTYLLVTIKVTFRMIMTSNSTLGYTPIMMESVRYLGTHVRSSLIYNCEKTKLAQSHNRCPIDSWGLFIQWNASQSLRRENVLPCATQRRKICANQKNATMFLLPSVSKVTEIEDRKVISKTGERYGGELLFDRFGKMKRFCR